jgi:hypothetical protein
MEFLVAHLNAAHNLACWLMPNETEAEDMVQEAHLRAVGHFAGFQGGAGRAWLLTIVRNSCYDHLRRKGASDKNTDFNEAIHSAGQQTPNPEAALLLTENRSSDEVADGIAGGVSRGFSTPGAGTPVLPGDLENRRNPFGYRPVTPQPGAPTVSAGPIGLYETNAYRFKGFRLCVSRSCIAKVGAAASCDGSC